MNAPRRPLLINVGFLLNAQIGYRRDIHFDYPVLNLEGEMAVENFTGVAQISRTPQGILVQCDFRCTTEADCLRCLEPVSADLHTQFSELFAFNERSVTESGLILRDDGNIDLEPLAREYLLLEVPISILCKPDCLGLCPHCGQDWNEGPCEHSLPPQAA